MNFVWYLFVAFLSLSVMVFLHEMGHFLVARAMGVKVLRFSIGFGKILKRVDCCGTEWAFSAVPLGGYVKMKGQEDDNPLAKNPDPDSYSSKKPWQRILILLAGPFANLLTAFVIYIFLAWHGAPLIAAKNYIPPIVGKVMDNSPAKKAGIKEGDKILAINGEKIKYWYQISLAISKKEPVDMVILRDNKKLNIMLHTMEVNGTNEFQQKIKRRVIGISPQIPKDEIIKFSGSEILFYAWNETKNASLLIVKGIGKMSTGEISSKNVGGPITIFDLLMKFAQAGFLYLLFISALFSVNLGILNLLPIPALDGGHIMFNLYEIITGRELSETVYYRLTILGWMILGAIMMLGFYNDINRLIGG